MPHCPLTKVITLSSTVCRNSYIILSLSDDYHQFLPSIAPFARAQRYHNEGQEALLPVPFHWVHAPALYFDHEIYHWIFCATVADIQALTGDLGHSGLHEDDSDDSRMSP